MVDFTDIVWRFRDDEALFEHQVNALARLGGRFEDYATLVQGDSAGSISRMNESPDQHGRSSDVPDRQRIKFHCGCIAKRGRGAAAIAVLTDPQLATLNWVFASDGEALAESVIEMVRACYSDEKPEGWWDLRDAPPQGVKGVCGFYGGIPLAPMVSPGHVLEEFIRVSDIYIDSKALMFGVRVKVGWSKGQIGLQYQGRKNKKTGVALFRCIAVGPGDLVTR